MVDVGSLNIKNEETFRLAHELAEATCQSVTSAVTQSLRESLSRVKANGKDDFVERWMKRIHETNKRLKGPPLRSSDIDDLLYDEMGLPK
jgi:hypothetical protein